MFVTGPTGLGGPGMAAGAERAAVPRPNRGPLTPPRPSAEPVLGTVGLCLWAWVLSSGGTDRGPQGPAPPEPPIPNPIPSIPWQWRLCHVSPGLQARRKSARWSI